MRRIVLILIGLSALTVSVVATADGDSVRPSNVSEITSPFSGVASCSSSGCHGGDVGRAGGEQSTWADGDPHARAYRILFNNDSVRIAKNLRLPNAHEATACLVCHGPNAEPCQATTVGKHDGVGCESCHGSSERWRTTHYESGWKSLSISTKADLGLKPTKDLVSRIEGCVSCHVGDANREVNHDMIAAGHPRLAFEAAKYHTSPRYRKHWVDSGPTRDFELRLWMIGQVANARAAVRLAIARIDRGKTRIDLAELNCFACHKSLTKPTNTNGVPGWQSWNVALLPMLADFSSNKVTAVSAFVSDPTHREKAVAADRELTQWLDDLRMQKAIDDQTVSRLTQAIAMHAAKLSHWDAHAPHHLALAAIAHADPIQRQRLREPLERLGTLVHYPPDANSPGRYDAEVVSTIFRSLSP